MIDFEIIKFLFYLKTTFIKFVVCYETNLLLYGLIKFLFPMNFPCFFEKKIYQFEDFYKTKVNFQNH